MRSRFVIVPCLMASFLTGPGIGRATAESFRVAEVVTLPGHRPLASMTWSPAIDRLLVQSATSTYVLDAATGSTLREILPNHIGSHVWSPDGESFVATTRIPEKPLVSDLVAASTDSLVVETLAKDSRFPEYHVDRDGHVVMGAPRSSAAATMILRSRLLGPGRPSARPQLVKYDGLRIAVIPGDASEARSLQRTLDSLSLSHSIWVVDAPRGAPHFLLATTDGQVSSLVVGYSGEIVANLSGLDFYPTALTPDGAHVFGARGQVVGDDIVSGTIVYTAIDSLGLEPLSGAPGGLAPQISASGKYIAYHSADGATTYVGTLDRRDED